MQNVQPKWRRKITSNGDSCDRSHNESPPLPVASRIASSLARSDLLPDMVTIATWPNIGKLQLVESLSHVASIAN